MSFFKKRKIKKQLSQLVRHARTFRSAHVDIMKPADLSFLDERLSSAKTILKRGTSEEMAEQSSRLNDCLEELDPPKKFSGWRDNFDVLVVAVSVAMAFRAYFYQPFKIPTGSMQPTLYGIHTVSIPPEKATLTDRQPFLFFKWLITGESFQIVRAKATGSISFGNSSASKKPGYTPILIAGIPHYVPNDVVSYNQATHEVSVGNLKLTYGSRVREGEVIWSGKVISGDFVFVNRWLWNFRHPKRGEVMVFSTNGIRSLAQGTHYIKRMTGLPGETLQVMPPYLLVNGKRTLEPERIAQITRKEKLAPWAPNYAGFNPSGSAAHSIPNGSLVTSEDQVKLTADQYYAMGDNSFNSYDSRYWGPVPERNLLGPASVVYWPFTSPRFGRIK